MKESTVIITILLSLFVFVIPKRHLLLPFIVALCFIPVDQRVIIVGLDFTVLRMLVAAAMLRILLKKEQRAIRWNIFDKLFAIWAICGAVIYVFQWGDTRALIYKCGALFDIFGLYWIFRQEIHSWSEMKAIIGALAFCVLVMTPFILFEYMTKQNPFIIFGTVFTYERMGRFRCQGPFPHAILLGLFCATLLPLFVGMAMNKPKRRFYWLAAGASIFIVIASASSTAMITLLAVLGLSFLWRWRQQTSLGWKLFFVGLVSLHLVMQAPVWHLIGRLNVVGGSAGWHRYNLIDQAIKHFGEWALLGTRDTSHWDFGLADVTNQYVLEGVRGGLLAFVLFILILGMAFRVLQRNFRSPASQTEQWLSWCLFVALLGHCVAFLGVSYFGQINLLWYLVLSIISFVLDTENQRRSAVRPLLIVETAKQIGLTTRY